jgi:hypothetical protein
MQEYTQRHARKYSKAGKKTLIPRQARKHSKAGKIRLKYRLQKTLRQARKGFKASK